MTTRRLAFVIEYDGTAYAGWQRQPHAPTVQAVLEESLARITQAPCPIVGAGRTDAGVHALGQVAHGDSATGLPPERLRQALNALLPGDVAVRRVLDAPPDFHARRDARLRIYRYVVLSRPEPPALLRRYVHQVPGPIDLAAMRDAAALLRGRHDFGAFRAAGTPTATTVCDVRALAIDPRGRLVVFTVAADRFLRQMVRRLVGTLLAVGTGSLPREAVADILDGRGDARTAPPAPACGLYLARVRYAPGRLPEPQGPGPVL